MTSYFSESRLIKAPWSETKIAALRKYQTEGRYHPYTCCGYAMDVLSVGMVCSKCGCEQDWVLESTLQLMGVYE